MQKISYNIYNKEDLKQFKCYMYKANKRSEAEKEEKREVTNGERRVREVGR